MNIFEQEAIGFLSDHGLVSVYGHSFNSAVFSSRSADFQIISGPDLGQFGGEVTVTIRFDNHIEGAVAFEVEDVNVLFFKRRVVSPSTNLVSLS